MVLRVGGEAAHKGHERKMRKRRKRSASLMRKKFLISEALLFLIRGVGGVISINDTGGGGEGKKNIKGREAHPLRPHPEY